jgi:hypothetical protein
VMGRYSPAVSLTHDSLCGCNRASIRLQLLKLKENERERNARNLNSRANEFPRQHHTRSRR